MSNEILNGRYQVQRQLGRQTSRRTLLALDLHTSKQVVVKLLYLGQDFDWQDLKLFEREAETLKTLDHLAIPRYLDYFELDTPNDKGFGLVQSYVEGKSLEEHLQAGRTFSEAEVKELARSLLSILSYLHQKQPPVIHRDIKPSNILLTNRSGNSVGEVYLVDFGSVQTLAAQEGSTITVVGTYGYMPPEQFGGRTTPASDLYSLGATLIYLVTGLHPTELPQQELQIQFRQSVNLSLEFADWLEWMTDPSLEKRFLGVEEAIQALENPKPRKQEIVATKQPLKQPPGSKIRLIKTPDTLEIILPPKGFGIPSIAFISLITPIALGFYFFRFGESPVTAEGQGISFFIQMLAIALLASAILWGFCKRTHIIINSQRVELFNNFLGIHWWTYPSLTKQNISQLKASILSPELNLDTQPLLFDHRNSAKYYFVLYYLNSLSQFTVPELEWLKQELSDWLGLPIIGNR
ncbi:serine/threonine protein kinase [Nostoc sp. CENA67]|uniref:Serine/threonine protein kinase n=1 Tax=Amazonocrinis nigriterrae CENA67 TaxID=2794033 RepID=A0A8J7HVW5_9NOST|nr:serine/threonine-protein kinase [Amazonocrinis nigriterrae]MBH8564227.1 serine/threonine protein kinase [Amazonocrinis nigriterrae CENA67]